MILRTYLGNSKSIQDLAITNGHSLVIFTNIEYQIINFKKCIENPAQCLSCDLHYYLRISESASSLSGVGTKLSPYQQSRQVIVSQYKLQQLTSLILMHEIRLNYIF